MFDRNFFLLEFGGGVPTRYGSNSHTLTGPQDHHSSFCSGKKSEFAVSPLIRSMTSLQEFLVHCPALPSVP